MINKRLFSYGTGFVCAGTAVACLLTVGCGGGGTAMSTPVNPTAAAPAFSVAAGTYTSAQTVALTDATAAATIYYTTDGSTPTTGSAKYSTPLVISSTTTLSAIAGGTGYTSSGVSTAVYTISAPAARPRLRL